MTPRDLTDMLVFRPLLSGHRGLSFLHYRGLLLPHGICALQVLTYACLSSKKSLASTCHSFAIATGALPGRRTGIVESEAKL